jgi:RNA-directed DNA polymerase
VLAKKAAPQWVLEGDIRAHFDRISHDWIMAHVPMYKTILQTWLTAGYLEDHTLHPTEAGTPQGGPLSPLLSNILLDKLDKELENRGHRFVRYADDLCVFVRSKRSAERVMKSIIR